MPLQEDALWNTSVLDPWFNNMDGIIIKIIVDNALS